MATPSFLISFTNIRSIIPKRDTICSFLEDNNSDILVLTETWLYPAITNNEVLAGSERYNIYRKDRVDRRGGGVLLGVKNTISSYVLNLDSPIEIIWIMCVTKHAKILVGNCYRPPDYNNTFVRDLRHSIKNAKDLCPTGVVYLFGDFNLPLIDWTNFSSPCCLSTEFINLVLDFNLSQVIDQPTRGLNTLDLLLTNAPDSVRTVSCLRGFSDHNLIEVTLDLPVPFAGISKKKIRDYSKAEFDKISAQLEEFFSNVLFPSFYNRSVNENWVLFRDKMSSLINQYIPVITVSNDLSNPWFTKSLRKQRNKKKRLYCNAKRSATPSAWEKYKQYLTDYCKAICNAKEKYFHNDLPSLLQNNPKKFWRLISPDHGSNQLSLLNENNIPLSDYECSTTFNTFFSSVFSQEDSSDVPHIPDYNFQYMQPIEITVEGIACRIKQIKASSSAGIDDINSKVIKNTVSISSITLYHIFRQSLSSGKLPDDWKIAKVVPIFKSGDKNSPKNYRPISLTCICCKLLEHIIASHVYSHLETNKFFFSNQHGFRKGMSCETQLLEFTTDIHYNINNGLQTDCIFLDFAKAFDRVAHCRLISKLSALRLDSLTLSWLRNFLSLRKQFTIVNNSSSPSSYVSSGVPQGSVLGPLLFLIYINDLPTNISSHIRIFADDCMLYRPINCPNDHSILQDDLNTISNWCSTWLMRLNTNKCKVVSFGRKQVISNFTYHMQCDRLSTATSYKYLGIHLTPGLSWFDHITNVCAKASKTLGYLRRNLRRCPTNIRKMSYLTFVRPQLEYASSVWSPSAQYQINMLETIQNRATRYISRNYDINSSVTQLKLHHSLQALNVRRHVSLLCLFHKYVYSNKTSSLHLQRPLYTSRRLHNHLSFTRIFGNTNAFNTSALPQAIRMWNDLPDDIASDSNPNTFRQKVQTHFLNISS